MMKLFECHQCGDRLTATEVAYSSELYVSGTAHTRVRAVNRYCAECHAVNEYKRHQEMQKSVAAALASLTPEELAGYMARKGVEA